LKNTQFSPYLASISTHHSPNKPNIFYLNQQAVFERDLGTKFYVRIWFHFRQGSMRNSIRIMDLKFKFCDIWDGSTENRLLKTILSEVRRTSNLPHMCPVKGNFLYKMENFTVTDKFVPTYAPFMNFTVALEFLENDKLFAITKVSGAVAPK
uniref:Uncharacterized protein n=1 Tax=Musca domestica TaxID=7370 RepID=A0A1I8NK81_MUSDO